MYETWHPHCDDPNRVKARINYTVWSEVFACPNCAKEIVFLDAAFDPETQRVADEFGCPNCGNLLTKGTVDKLLLSEFDAAIGEVVRTPKRVPVLVEYEVNGTKHLRKVDQEDIELINRISLLPRTSVVPYRQDPLHAHDA